MENTISSLLPLDPARNPAHDPAASRQERRVATASRARPVSADGLEQAVRKISDFVKTVRRDLEFSVDEVTGQTVIRVLDTETNELIRQIPPEEILEVARHLEEVTGVLFQGKA